MRKRDRDLVGGLAKGLAVIEAFEAASRRLSLAEAARKTGLTRAAARRYLLTPQASSLRRPMSGAGFPRIARPWAGEAQVQRMLEK